MVVMMRIAFIPIKVSFTISVTISITFKITIKGPVSKIVAFETLLIFGSPPDPPITNTTSSSINPASIWSPPYSHTGV